MSNRFLFLAFLLVFYIAEAQDRYYINKSTISFISHAPLETITASSTSMRGVIDPLAKTYAFSVETQSFKGFNSPLQREHFNENYMVSEEFPECTFTGKIIDDIDFKKNGTYIVRAKGMLTVKGIARERIIRNTVEIKNGIIEVSSSFVILLDDHSIRIPRIVNQKIAPEIKISMNALFVIQKNQK